MKYEIKDFNEFTGAFRIKKQAPLPPFTKLFFRALCCVGWYSRPGTFCPEKCLPTQTQVHIMPSTSHWQPRVSKMCCVFLQEKSQSNPQYNYKQTGFVSTGATQMAITTQTIASATSTNLFRFII